MEDKNQTACQASLSRTSAYLLGLAQVKGNSLEQQILMLVNSKYAGNDIKKLVKTGNYTIETLSTVFKEFGMWRMYNVVKKVTDCMVGVCSHLTDTLDKIRLTDSAKQAQVQEEKKVGLTERKEIIDDLKQVKAKLKINKMRGISLFNQNYKRKIDSLTGIQEEQAKAKKAQQQKQQLNEKEFKRRLFIKMKNQLKQVQQDLYCPLPDEITTFMLFEKRFLQNFNHVSHSESIETITQYLQNSRMSALELLSKSDDMSEEISKFKIEIEILIKEAKNKTKERNQNISDKFQIILKEFIAKRKQALQKTQKKLNEYKKRLQNKQGRMVSIGVETHLRELGTLKGFEKKVVQLQQRYKVRQEERQKNYRALLDKTNAQKNQLSNDVTQLKVANKTLKDEIIELRKQNSQIISKIYEKKEQQKERERQKSSKLVKNSEKNIKNNFVSAADIEEGQAKSKQTKQKKPSVRLSNISKMGGATFKQEMIMGQREEPTIQMAKSKGKKVVSIKQIQNDSKTNTMINFEDGDTYYVFDKQFKANSHHKMSKSRKDIQLKRTKQSKKQNSKQVSNKRMAKSYKQLQNQPTEYKKGRFESTYTKKIIKTEQNEASIKKDMSQCSSVVDKNGKNMALRQTSKKNIGNGTQQDTYSKNKGILHKNAHQQTDGMKQKRPHFKLVRKETEQFEKLNKNLNLSMNEVSKPLIAGRMSENPSRAHIAKGHLSKLSFSKKTIGHLKSTHKFGQSMHMNQFQFTNVYSVSLNGGCVIQFENRVSPSSKSQKGGKFYDLKGNVVDYTRSILTQLKIQDQDFVKIQIRPQNKSKKGLRPNKYQSNSLHESNQKFLLDLQKQKKQSQQNSEIVVRVKSLFKQNMPPMINSSKQSLSFKKKLFKQLQSMEWKYKRDRQLSIPKIKQQTVNGNETPLFHEKIKLKQNNKLKKIKKKKEQFEYLNRKRRYVNQQLSQSPSKLPQIQVKSIF